MRTPLFFFLALTSLQSRSQLPDQQTPQVIVNGSLTDTEASRDFVAGKVVIGKQRISESGLQNVGEILRREPAITVGKDGRIGLLGLPGYTQILVDGMPHTGDAFSIDLVHIERIEIIKTTTAATGPFGIAGTINIIKKKAQRQTLTTMRIGGIVTGGQLGGDLAWSKNEAIAGTPFSYNLRLSTSYKPSPYSNSYEQMQEVHGGKPITVSDGERIGRSVFRTVIASSEFAWALNSSHKLSFSPDVAQITSADNTLEWRHWTSGRDTAIHQRNKQPLTGYSLPLQWNWQIDSERFLTLKANANRSHLDLNLSRAENLSDSSTDRRINNVKSLQSTDFLSVDFNSTSNSSHEFSAGAKLIRNRDDKRYIDLVNGEPDVSMAALGSRSFSNEERKQIFVQDEWRINRSVAVNIGASVEQRRYQLNESSIDSRTDFTMWSPSAHIAKKIGGDSKRQFRMSFARSFNPPNTDQMLLHPNLNSFAPCEYGQLCTANSIDTADSSGNPNLQPERARSLNFSYKHGVGKNSEVVLEFYRRDIKNKIGFGLELEPVPWASAFRYVYRPANLGSAEIRGIDLEGRLSGEDVGKSWKNVAIYGNVGWADSQLTNIQGPGNRVAGQTPWRAKLGGSYTMLAIPLKLSVDSSYLPSDWVRTALKERTYQSSKLTVAVNANWQVSPSSRLTLSFDNFIRRSSIRVEEYSAPAEVLKRITHTSTNPRISIRFENRL